MLRLLSMKSLVVSVASLVIFAASALAGYSPPDVGGPASSGGSGTRLWGRTVRVAIEP